MDNQKHLLTTAEAIKFVKKAKGEFALSIRLDAAIEDEKDRCFSDGCATYVKLSKREAVQIVSSMLSEVLENRGGRITIRQTASHDGRVVFWITQ